MATKKKPAPTPDALAEDGLKRDNFDLKQWVKTGGVKLVTSPVELYTDQETAYEALQAELTLAGIEQQISQMKGAKKASRALVSDDQDDLDALEERRTAVRAELLEIEKKKFDSRLTVNCRGTLPAHRKLTQQQYQRKLGKKPSQEHLQEWFEWQEAEMIRPGILSLEIHAEGRVVEGPFDNQFVRDLILMLPEDQEKMLLNHFTLINFGGEMADRSINAGFLGGDDELAGEPSDSDGGQDGD